MLNISKKMKSIILCGIVTTSVLGTTFVSAEGPWGPGPGPRHPYAGRSWGPPPPRHYHHDHYYRNDDNSGNNEAAAFIIGAVVGAVVEHNA